jgi:pSer/pThr/pTyr-binding forkhead associated (FHA) protein
MMEFMSLVIKATSGPLEGQKFAVVDGLSIGRAGATININDPKVSTTHATLSERDGRWILKDNKSKNGLRDAGGERVVSLEIKAGAVFQVGDSAFQVELDSPIGEIELPATGVGEAEIEAVVPAPEKKRRKISWNDALAGFLESHAEKFEDNPLKLKPLSPTLVLEFVRGAQVNSRWVLGFGPRKVGAECLDLPIWEPDAPPVCFEIHPGTEGLVFKTAHSKQVRLNGQKVDRQVLRMGDSIQIGETLIEVDFDDELGS